MQLGKLGFWGPIDGMTSPQLATFAKAVEDAGYAAWWIPEGFGRNSLVAASWLLANTSRLVIATGIANIYARDAMAMVSARDGLNEQSGGRFLLGMGVSHAPVVDTVRGHAYGKPVPAMRAYLEAMGKVQLQMPQPPERPLTVIAALGPKMLELARDMADGAHPYNVPPEHTREARATLGPGKLLCVEQAILAETDPAKARETARAKLAIYMSLPNYCNNWRRLGFDDQDFANGGSDRLIDTVVAWGDDDVLCDRVRAHWSNGADHVCIHQMTADGMPDLDLLRRLAARLG